MSQVNKEYINFAYSFAVSTIIAAGCSTAIPSAIVGGIIMGGLSVAASRVHVASEPYFRNLLTGSNEKELSHIQNLLRRQIIIIGIALVAWFNPIRRVNLLFTAVTDLAGTLIYKRYFTSEENNDFKKVIYFPLPL